MSPRAGRRTRARAEGAGGPGAGGGPGGRPRGAHRRRGRESGVVAPSEGPAAPGPSAPRPALRPREGPAERGAFGREGWGRPAVGRESGRPSSRGDPGPLPRNPAGPGIVLRAPSWAFWRPLPQDPVIVPLTLTPVWEPLPWEAIQEPRRDLGVVPRSAPTFQPGALGRGGDLGTPHPHLFTHPQPWVMARRGSPQHPAVGGELTASPPSGRPELPLLPAGSQLLFLHPFPYRQPGIQDLSSTKGQQCPDALPHTPAMPPGTQESPLPPSRLRGPPVTQRGHGYYFCPAPS